MDLKILRTLLRGLVPLTRTPDELADLTSQLDAPEGAGAATEGETPESPAPTASARSTTTTGTPSDPLPRVERRKVLRGPGTWFRRPSG